MPKLSIPIALKTALTSLLTRRLFYGAAIACAVGLGLGAWLEPPKSQFATGGATTVTLPQEQPDPWSGDATAVSSRPYDQPASDPGQFQTAAVSPPAAAEPFHLIHTEEIQADPSGDASPSQQNQPAQDSEAPPASPRPSNSPGAGTTGDSGD